MRGLKAPPRSMEAPLSFTEWEIFFICSGLSTEQGPAMTVNLFPPTGTPLTSMMLSSGWNIRLARLKGSCTRRAFSTSGLTRNSSGSKILVSPTIPKMVWFTPMLSWIVKPRFLSPASTPAIASFGAPFFITIIIATILLKNKKAGS